MMRNPIRVLIAGAEVSPFAKVGGLADVLGSLPFALHKNNVSVKLILPRYSQTTNLPSKQITKQMLVPFRGIRVPVSVYKAFLPSSSIEVFLVDHLQYMRKDGIYPQGEEETTRIRLELLRFLLFNRAIVELLPELHWKPNIIHVNDWHAALVPSLLKIKKRESSWYQEIKTLLTIHNIAYQGVFSPEIVFGILGVSYDALSSFKKMNARGVWFNFLQQGVLHADLINTVSPTFAKEILTKKFGSGLEAELRSKRDVLYGILNGIDYERFNPETDPCLIETYNAKNLRGKNQNKLFLQKRFGFKRDDRIPLIGMVTRLVEQKGLDILIPAIDKEVFKNFHLVILGEGEKRYEKKLLGIKGGSKNRISVTIAFDDTLARRIYAGADFFLMPSRFEPCGLGQMIAMRYGAVPIVRSTGGLKDTVVDPMLNPRNANGVSFSAYSARALERALLRAFSFYRNKTRFVKLIKNAFKSDFSWERSSKEYVSLYQKLLNI